MSLPKVRHGQSARDGLAYDPHPLFTMEAVGMPRTQGSVNSTRTIQRGGKTVRLPVTSGWEDLKVWRHLIAVSAKNALTQGIRQGLWTRDQFPLDEPVIATVVYTVPRPQRPRFPAAATKPDIDKLDRALHDGLSIDAGILREDSRIIGHLRHLKTYPNEDFDALDEPGVMLVLWRSAHTEARRRGGSSRAGSAPARAGAAR
ncbi:hypothetical protein GS504_01060 [Rhodococcus hoagii]|nr:hypothetical protein [Prescottella equi]NKS71737.1 hypothetical protein [Prescottella equi]